VITDVSILVSIEYFKSRWSLYTLGANTVPVAEETLLDRATLFLTRSFISIYAPLLPAIKENILRQLRRLGFSATPHESFNLLSDGEMSIDGETLAGILQTCGVFHVIIAMKGFVLDLSEYENIFQSFSRDWTEDIRHQFFYSLPKDVAISDKDQRALAEMDNMFVVRHDLEQASGYIWLFAATDDEVCSRSTVTKTCSLISQNVYQEDTMHRLTYGQLTFTDLPQAEHGPYGGLVSVTLSPLLAHYMLASSHAYDMSRNPRRTFLKCIRDLASIYELMRSETDLKSGYSIQLQYRSKRLDVLYAAVPDVRQSRLHCSIMFSVNMCMLSPSHDFLSSNLMCGCIRDYFVFIMLFLIQLSE
jgi:hypothetical protein